MKNRYHYRFIIIFSLFLAHFTSITHPLTPFTTFCSSSFVCLKKISSTLFYPQKVDTHSLFSIPAYTDASAHTFAHDIRLQHHTQNKSPYPFLIGASTSEHQSSNRCTASTCSWSAYAQATQLPQPLTDTHMLNLADNYKEYFKQARAMGLNSIRFSIEWALVEPVKGEFNRLEIERYADMACQAIQNGITPVICLHHYTDPVWFLNKGGFEKKENIYYFVRFCTLIYTAITQALSDNKYIHAGIPSMHPIMWATFNNPTGYAFRGYYTNEGPPSKKKKKGLKWVSKVIKNTMEAHVQVYQGLNKAYLQAPLNKNVIKKPFIGFLKNMPLLDPSYKTITHTLLSPLSKVANRVANMITQDSVFTFFKTGIFAIRIPTKVSIVHKNKQAPSSLDFIGVNYYSNIHTVAGKKVIDTHPLTSTDNSTYRIYPHGLYRAIRIVSNSLAKPLNIPLYVTENGIATQDELKRKRFYHDYMYVLKKSIADNYNVRGYLTWTLADNYEWPTKDCTIKKQYGICKTTGSNNEILIPKEGSEWFLRCAQYISAPYGS